VVVFLASDDSGWLVLIDKSGFVLSLNNLVKSAEVVYPCGNSVMSW
jgi:hypothetical protein